MLTQADDSKLVAAAQAGDRAAMDALLRSHYDRIYALCRRITGHDADALDATQEAMISIVRGLHRYDGRAAFGTWAYRVAFNACLDELRRRKRRPEPRSDDYEFEKRDSGPSFDDSLADRMNIDEALASLPDEFRVAVVLRDQLGLDYAEIATVLEIPPGTVRSRIARGRAGLAERLRGNQDQSTAVEENRP